MLSLCYSAALGAERIPTCKCGDLRSVLFLYFLPTELNMGLRQNLAVWREVQSQTFWRPFAVLLRHKSSGGWGVMGGDLPSFILGSSLLMFWRVAADFLQEWARKAVFQQLLFLFCHKLLSHKITFVQVFLNKYFSLYFIGFPGGRRSVGFQVRPFLGL